MSIKVRPEDALNYHSSEPKGKIEVLPTKPLSSQADLALAYSPGVAEPCKKIAENKDDVFKYTAKGNLVAVITNGTAVLGLGAIGPEASKPVMEGKGVLFKNFAGIDVFDIEIDETDPDKFCQIVKALEPTFGGINLEDIKAPESFYIEEKLKREMNIPVMHDDQHGTAIISAAALINALEVVNKKMEEIKVVVSGAGAAAVACSNIYLSLGLKKENLIMFDSQGVLNKERDDLDKLQSNFATDRDIHSLAEAIKGADFFLGLSVADVLKPEMIKEMAENPILFALANPNPEIDPDEAIKVRPDAIMATGRSDHPNQVNNVLGFPYIFRGALDVRAKKINEEMKLAAVYALAQLAKEQVPELVNKAYGEDNLQFGRNYLIPKPVDPRLITRISPAVAKAAMDSGVSRTQINDWEQYKRELELRVGLDQKLMTKVIDAAVANPKKIVFAEADNIKILKASQILLDEGIAVPVLLGNKEKILKLIKEYNLDLKDTEIIDPLKEPEKREKFAEFLFEKRQRKGLSLFEAKKLMRERNYFGSALVEFGYGDALISGLTRDYPHTIKPALEVIGTESHIKKVAGMYIINTKKGTFFFADTTVNTNPNAEELVDMIGLADNAVRFFDIEPRFALLSYSNFGSAKGEVPTKTALATRLAKEKFPHLTIDGEIQANFAVNTDLQQETFPFSKLAETGANTLIFPDLASGNIAYKLLSEIGGAEAIGPVLMGMGKPVHILQLGSSIRDIVNMVSIAVVDAQKFERNNK